MRRGDENRAAGFCDAMKFFHGGDDVGDVFDHVLAADVVEGVVFERERAFIEMRDDVGGGVHVHIEADRAGIFFGTAAYVENARQIVSSSLL
jgi:hypothetical protein